MITFRCSCGKQLKVKEDRAETKVKCPECEEVLLVPEAGGIQKKPIPRRADPIEDDDSMDERPRHGFANRDRQAKGGHGLLIGLIVGGIVLLAGAGAGLYFFLGSKSLDATDMPPADVIVKRSDTALLGKNLKQLAFGLLAFNDLNWRLPSPGFSKDPKAKESKPLLSWRVAILPFIKEENLYRQFNLHEPWDSPHNLKLLENMPEVFRPVGSQKAKPGYTFLQLVTGPGTLYPTPTSIAKMPHSFRHGSGSTIVIVEAAEPVPWTKPADLSIDVTNVEQGAVPKLGALFPHGFCAAMGDCAVYFVDRRQVSDRTIRTAMNPAEVNEMLPDWSEIRFIP